MQIAPTQDGISSGRARTIDATPPIREAYSMTTIDVELADVKASDEGTRTSSEVTYVCVDEVRFNRLTADLDAARRMNTRQSLAMATAGHDLRQHLQNIVLALDLIRCTLVDPKSLEWLSTAQEQAGCLIRGLEGLAREANIHAYQVQHERSSFPIAKLLTRIARKWLPAANAKNLQLKIDQSPARVRSNPDLLFAVIDNLVSNAIKHTGRGSVGIYLCVERNALLVSIQDTGPGLSPENMEAVFQPRWHGTGNHAGMGLGLAIVQSTASLLDHQITLNSHVGRGTCFTVHVPLAAAMLEGASRSTKRQAAWTPFRAASQELRVSDLCGYTGK
jgi:signal transduction histidine kinase